MKKLIAVFCIVGLFIMLSSGAFGADENKGSSSVKQSAQNVRPPKGSMPMNRNIAFIAGSITKIDATVPGSVKVEIVNDADGKSHLVDIGPGTNILKVVDAADLKAGDKAKIVARKADDKEIALSVVTGNLKEMQMTKPPAPGQVRAPIMKKDQTKK